VDPERLRQSWARVAANGEQVADRFYAWLFVAHPDLRQMFPLGMAAQRDKLVAALGRIVSSADQADVLVPFVQALGRDHRRFGVLAEHYGQVGEALLATLAYFEGDEWTPELSADWLAAYDLVAKTMSSAADQAERYQPAWWEAEVVAHERRTPDLAVITVRPNVRMDYRCGQSVAVESHLRPRVWRYLSPANAPRPDGTVEFHVRAVAGGSLSPALVHSLQVGDVLRMGAPLGERLLLDHTDPADLLLLAGGTGLAPMKAVVEEVASDVAMGSAPRRVDLVVGARRREDLYDLVSLQEMESRLPWFTVVPAVSEETGYAGAGGDAVDVALGRGLADGRTVHVCGSREMVHGTLARLREAGVPERSVHFEDFDNHHYVPSAVPAETKAAAREVSV
jgi:NAD(P)H-flavin reductase